MSLHPSPGIMPCIDYKTTHYYVTNLVGELLEVLADRNVALHRLTLPVGRGALPEVCFAGHWLTGAGFRPGQRLSLCMMRGLLILRAEGVVL